MSDGRVLEETTEQIVEAMGRAKNGTHGWHMAGYGSDRGRPPPVGDPPKGWLPHIIQQRRLRRAISVLIQEVLVWWIGLAFAGKAESITKLLDAGRFEAAQKRCVRLSAFLPETEAALREACARAHFPLAQADGSAKAWLRFQTDWAGTEAAHEARLREAEARLAELGEEAPESAYLQFLERFGDTPAAATADALRIRAAIREIANLEDARRVARAHPDAPGLTEAIAPWFHGFIQLDVVDGQPRVTIDPPLPGTPQVGWAAKMDGHVIPWEPVALEHLERHGLSAARARLLLPSGTRSFPPCSLPEAELGVQVRLGTLHAFLPHPIPCGGDSPGFVSVRDGAVVGIALGPGPGLRLAGADGRAVVRWGTDPSITIPLLGDFGADIIPLGNVVGQQVGAGHLVTPLAGGLPWYAPEDPPPTAQPLPTGLAGPLPEGYRASAAPSGDLVVSPPGTESPRVLPPGDLRVLSPLYQELTGLHDRHPALQRSALPPLPPDFWPEEMTPVEAEPEAREQLEHAAERFGLLLDRAWQVQLAPDPKLEIAFEGRFEGRPVRGILDPRERTDSWRLFVVDAPGERYSPIVFRHQGVVHFAWVGQKEGRAAMHFFRSEPRGWVTAWLVR